MGEIEQLNNKAPKEQITTLAALKAKVGILNEQELSPEDERTKVLANSLEQLADLNNGIREDHYPSMIPANPPTYELLSSTTN